MKLSSPRLSVHHGCALFCSLLALSSIFCFFVFSQLDSTVRKGCKKRKWVKSGICLEPCIYSLAEHLALCSLTLRILWFVLLLAVGLYALCVSWHCHQVMRGLLWQGVTAYPVAKEYLTRKAELGMEAEVTLLFSPKVCYEKF